MALRIQLVHAGYSLIQAVNAADRKVYIPAACRILVQAIDFAD